MKPLPLRKVLSGIAILAAVFFIGTMMAFSFIQGRITRRLVEETEDLAVESRGLGERADSLRAAVLQVRGLVRGEIESLGPTARSWSTASSTPSPCRNQRRCC